MTVTVVSRESSWRALGDVIGAVLVALETAPAEVPKSRAASLARSGVPSASGAGK